MTQGLFSRPILEAFQNSQKIVETRQTLTRFLGYCRNVGMGPELSGVIRADRANRVIGANRKFK